ncbi:MAG TPA: Hsp20/alpha crystallin family protein [Aquabacterium sp.]|uniref:Hsp20/alpha crystallin family protein n=1 Tax=Aquabacterium sp. TaxID=1872578 RepID=UPI002E32DFBC|nr:Hsp20/alpha crystallin family protein [Aquabacterium sp.]HEX5355815.1 Hsp20/alpha crystallin family protein [Aquabacterium sp.]
MSNVTRYSPMDELFRGFFVKPMDLPNSVPPQQIRMDVKEQEGAYLVHAEIPGVKKEDIHVEIEGNQVSISSEVKQEKEVKDGERVLRSERYYGQVSRSFQLAHEIDEGKAQATFNNGVLELTLPKKAASSGKRLTIN